MCVMNNFKERAGWTAIGFGLRALAAMLNRIGKKDPLLKRALEQFDGTYRFRNGDGALSRNLVFGNGKVKAVAGSDGEPDFTFTLYEPPAYYLKTRPDRVLELVIGNRIAHAGDMYYLYQFGFIVSLMDNYYRSKKAKKKSRQTSANRRKDDRQ